MRFKKNKVWVAVDSSDQPVLKNGKALIKYQLEQDYTYRVLAENLHHLGKSDTSVGPQNTKSIPASSSRSSTTNIDPQSAIQVFTDGACSGNPGPAGIGIVMRYKNKRKEIARHIGTATNNIAELEAIRVALLSIKNRELPVLLYTDSQYALGLLTKGWKAKSNVDLVKKIRALAADFPRLQFIKIRGHAGHEDNERADQLAVQAIRQKK